MTDLATVSTSRKSRAAGQDLATQILSEFGGKSPDAVIVFAAPDNDFGELLDAITRQARPGALIGCSSAGEFTELSAGTGMTSALALRAPDMKFTATMAGDLSTGREKAALSLLGGFKGVDSADFRYRTAILLVDALAGHAEDLVDQLTLHTGGTYQFVGGGAGDDALFKQTHVFCGVRAATNAAVALEILSNKPIGIGARHGWSTTSDPLRVTETAESCVLSLNVSPAADAFEEHANATSQQFDRSNPMPFFLHNVVGVKTDEGHKLRVPLGIGKDGGVTFAAEIPTGATAQIMSTRVDDAVSAAAEAVADARQQVEKGGHRVKGALFFDCVATRLRLGEHFATELDAVKTGLGDARFAGFNSYGQIVRADGQFSGFHNCTAVVCAFPD